MVRVLFLSEYYPPAVHGGGELSCAALAQHLARSGVAVTVLTSRVRGLPAERTERGVRVLRTLRTGNTARRMLSNAQRMLFFRNSLLGAARKLLAQEPFDLIHCFNMTTIPAVQLKTEFPIPFIAHINSLTFACPKGDLLYHGKSLCTINCDYRTFVPCLRDSSEIGKMRNSPLLSYNPLALSTIYARYFNQRRLLPQFNHCIAISTFLKQRLVRLGIPAKRVNVVHNIIDLTKFKTRSRKRRATVRMLYLGALTATKGIPELLTALSGMPGDWRCDLYGDGPLGASVVAATQRDSRLHCHNPVPSAQLPKLYATADLVLFPSRWPEPLGRVALEAMSAGKPVIASRIGGIMDTLTPQTAILVPPGNAAALRTGIAKLLRNPTLRKRLGAAGSARVRTHFAPKALTAQVRALYRKVLA